MNQAEVLVNDVISRLQGVVLQSELIIISNVMYLALGNYEIREKSTDVAIRTEDIDAKAYEMFFISKKVEGKSDETIKYYKYVINRFLNMIQLPVTQITSESIKYYLASRQMKDKVSETTCDNERRVISSLCSFMLAEEYISKDPSKRVKKIKSQKKVKKSYSGIELEQMRDKAKNIRDKALLEVLYSTGCRVSEVVGMNISDVRGDELIVTGKGNKQRVVYLNERAIFMLSAYIGSRKDEKDALFVSLHSPHDRIGKSQIENIVRDLGRSVGIDKSHPHRFRRTVATNAVNRGMPIDEVRQMLGHESIQTTLVYANTALANVKADHKKFIV